VGLYIIIQKNNLYLVMKLHVTWQKERAKIISHTHFVNGPVDDRNIHWYFD